MKLLAIIERISRIIRLTYMEIRIQCMFHAFRAGGGEGKTDKNGQKEGEREKEKRFQLE